MCLTHGFRSSWTTLISLLWNRLENTCILDKKFQPNLSDSDSITYNRNDSPHSTVAPTGGPYFLATADIYCLSRCSNCGTRRVLQDILVVCLEEPWSEALTSPHYNRFFFFHESIPFPIFLAAWASVIWLVAWKQRRKTVSDLLRGCQECQTFSLSLPLARNAIRSLLSLILL